ncbi:MAG: heavy metal-responsive transcriptional regulator [Terriglobia bacterium]
MAQRNGNLFIGEAARRTGLTIHTIRFYETQRLLPEAPRTGSGYRVYAEEDIEELRFIKGAQELGFSLKEIRELLLLRSRKIEACSHVKDLLEEKLKQVRAKLRELEEMEHELKKNLAACERKLRRRHPGRPESCPVLTRLGRKA